MTGGISDFGLRNGKKSYPQITQMTPIQKNNL